MKNDPRLLMLSPLDNVFVLTAAIQENETIQISGTDVSIPQTLQMGHKLAAQPIQSGVDILKYGFPIGFAASDIPLGAHVHVHNLTSRHTVVEVME